MDSTVIGDRRGSAWADACGRRRYFGEGPWSCLSDAGMGGTGAGCHSWDEQDTARVPEAMMTSVIRGS
ncbi:hypothetical protein ACFPM0_14025 [Pseudonocardia sulfidoxydans]|uniref:hypothetical protein n=1 Tax=Pseudonocardia sulfidoxydans TaxID=54011 RepID=UPI003610DE79